MTNRKLASPKSIYHFCTYFDQNYLARGLCLFRSLQRHARPFTLSVLCLDDTTYKILSTLGEPELVPISLQEFERGDEPLLHAKQNRSLVEYYFTLTPSLPLYLLNQIPDNEVITYLDADLWFFSNPEPIFRELGEESILIIGHRFPEPLRSREKTGVYNVGFLSFRNDHYGRACLEWWRERCLEWCYDREEAGRFADQKYLDDWTSRFEHVVVLEHKGANVAPWNVARYTLEEHDGTVWVDSGPLIFFHFHWLKMISPFLYDPHVRAYGGELNGALKDRIYAPYLRELQSTIRRLGADYNRTSRQLLPDKNKSLFQLLFFGWTLLVLGPLAAEIHLATLLRPYFVWRHILPRLVSRTPA